METIAVATRNQCLFITLNRPKQRNAMNQKMVDELDQIFSQEPHAYRALVIRGSHGHFCAGGDVGAMSTFVEHGQQAELRQMSRSFGRLLQKIEAYPCPVICLLEGTVLGGGLGLLCVSDIAFALENTTFGLPETSLGILPAQIAPFVIRRIGLTKTRRIALTAARFHGRTALNLGLVHEIFKDVAMMEAALEHELLSILRCGPQANQETKALLLSEQPLDSLLDQAAQAFARALCSEEGREGTNAFKEKRSPNWHQQEHS